MQDYLNYTQILDEAMHSLIKNVLLQVAKYGLYGEHHLYISFVTSESGVQLSKRMLNLYPNEITIVLQHQYTDLKVENDKFSVKLFFNGICENIVVPFKCITSFADPGANFVIHTHLAKKTQEQALGKRALEERARLLEDYNILQNLEIFSPKSDVAGKGKNTQEDKQKKSSNTKTTKGKIIQFDQIKAKALSKKDTKKD